MTDRKLLKEARDLIVMCSLIDKSSQCNDMVNRIDEQLAIPRVSQQRELLIGLLTKLENGGSAFIDKEQIVDDYLKAN